MKPLGSPTSLMRFLRMTRRSAIRATVSRLLDRGRTRTQDQRGGECPGGPSLALYSLPDWSLQNKSGQGGKEGVHSMSVLPRAPFKLN